MPRASKPIPNERAPLHSPDMVADDHGQVLAALGEDVLENVLSYTPRVAQPDDFVNRKVASSH